MNEHDDHGQVLHDYEFNTIMCPFLRQSAMLALTQCHGGTLESLCKDPKTGCADAIQVINLSAKHKTSGEYVLPLQVHARTTKAFPKGSLFLFPYADADHFLQRTRENQLKLEKLVGASPKDAAVHQDMVSTQTVHAESKAKKRKRASEESHRTAPEEETGAFFDVYSPFLDLRDQKKRKKEWVSINPFWALLHAPTSSWQPNMKLDVMQVVVPSSALEGTTRPAGFKLATQFTTTVRVPFAVNTRHVRADEVLVLPRA